MSEKLRAPCLTWHHPGVAPHAILLCLHGLGLHAGMFRTFAEQMAKHGVITYALDIRGFGAWRNQHRDRLDLLGCLNDVKEKVEELRQSYPQLPVYLLGESLGGAISTRFAADNPGCVEGLIIISPARKISDHKAAIAKVLLSLLLTPRLPINLSDVIARRAPRLVAAQDEPTVRLDFSLAELLHLSLFIRSAVNSARRVMDTPVLMLQGHSDRLITTRSTVLFFEQLSVKDKDLIILGDADHLMIQSPEVHARAVAIITDWIAERSEPKILRRAG